MLEEGLHGLHRRGVEALAGTVFFVSVLLLRSLLLVASRVATVPAGFAAAIAGCCRSRLGGEATVLSLDD